MLPLSRMFLKLVRIAQKVLELLFLIDLICMNMKICNMVSYAFSLFEKIIFCICTAVLVTSTCDRIHFSCLNTS